MALKPTNPRVRFSPKIMIPGGFNGNGKTPLIILPEGQTITGDYYRQNIQPVYFNFLMDDDRHNPGVASVVLGIWMKKNSGKNRIEPKSCRFG